MKTSSIAIGLSAVAFAGCSSVVEPPGDGATSARVRVAHLSPDAPAVDFCLAPAGTQEFAGPVYAGAGAPLGLSYGHATKYLDVAAGQYDVRLVAPGSADCSRGLVPDITGLPEIEDGVSVTLAATGLLEHGAGEPFALRAYLDDTSVESGSAKLRFVHASPGTPAVDVGLGEAHTFQLVFSHVSFGNTATNAPVDAFGFVEAAPFTSAVSARLAGSSYDALTVRDVSLGANTIETAIAIGGKTGSATNPLQVLLCADTAKDGLLAHCRVAP